MAEFKEMADAYVEREKVRLNDTITLAWLIGKYARMDHKFPSLDSELVKEKTEQTKEQTPDQMLAALRLINAAHGGTEVVT